MSVANIFNESVCLKPGSESTLVRVAKNTAVIQGTAVTLECSKNVGDSTLFWYDSSCLNDGDSNKCTSDVIYAGYGVISEYQPRFSVTPVDNATHNTRDLNINPTQLTDAGVYLCAEFINGLDIVSYSSIQLVVLGMKNVSIQSMEYQIWLKIETSAQGANIT